MNAGHQHQVPHDNTDALPRPSASRVQLTSDGHKAYLKAVEGAFGNAIDYAMLVKMYEGDSGMHTPAERRTRRPSARARSSS